MKSLSPIVDRSLHNITVLCLNCPLVFRFITKPVCLQVNTNDRNLAKTCPICIKDFGEGNPSRPNICELLKKGTDKVNEASHKRGRDDVVVAEGLIEFTGIAVYGIPMNGIYKHH